MLLFPVLLCHGLVLFGDVAGFKDLPLVRGLVHERAGGFDRQVGAVLLKGHPLGLGLLHGMHNESASTEAHCQVLRWLEVQRIDNP